MSSIQQWLNDNFARLVAEHEVPGAAIAVLHGDETDEAAAGVLSMRTGVEVTTDSVFQIGSITKVWHTTLAIRLVDEGKLDLDQPVRTYLPGFRVADEEVSASVTVRQLLCHLGGFEGDIFTPTTTGEDAIEKYVSDVMPGIRQTVRPGELYSYNNAGFVALGRIVEVLREMPWAQALREGLLDPLGLEHAATSATEAILHRAATGHSRPSPDAELEPAKVWALCDSTAPAGALLSMSARSVLALAQLHISGGLAPDGTRLLTEASVAAMRQRHAEVPAVGIRARGWGLGWALYDWPGSAVIGHDGGTIGQSAYLRVVPERGVAIALLTNGGHTIPLYSDVFTHLLGELTDVEMPQLPQPPAEPQPLDNPERYTGTYEVTSARLDVEADGPGLRLTSTPQGDLAKALETPPDSIGLVRLDGESFVSTELREGTYPLYTFVGDDSTGRAEYLHTGRAIPRVR